MTHTELTELESLRAENARLREALETSAQAWLAIERTGKAAANKHDELIALIQSMSMIEGEKARAALKVQP